jgi:hypothetical protein
MNTKLPKRSLEQEVEFAIQQGLKELLENKHLYQSVTIEFNEVRLRLSEVEQEEIQGRLIIGNPHRLITDDDIKNVKASTRQLLAKRMSKWTNGIWVLIDEKSANNFTSEKERMDGCRFAIPSIKTYCTQCKSGPWPHNPARESGELGYSFEYIEKLKHIQTFLLPYQCQNCKADPLAFLVKRDGLKLTLVGRSQFPEVLVPDFIPENQRKFYRNSVIASQTNFTLAAVLYLRTLIEQHFYQVVPKCEIEAIKGNPTGDELADLYATTLPKSFPGSFPSLKKAYNDLSEVLHRGNEDDDASKKFLSIKNDVEKHFDALRVFNSVLSK